jgi:hypothetical protein
MTLNTNHGKKLVVHHETRDRQHLAVQPSLAMPNFATIFPPFFPST